LVIGYWLLVVGHWLAIKERRQEAEGRRLQGKEACTVSFLTFFNWWAISAAPHCTTNN